jgi:dimethylargininase
MFIQYGGKVSNTKVKYSKALVCTPAENFSEGITHGKLGKPDYQKTLEQHAAYVDVLQQAGLDITDLADFKGEERSPDDCFVEDAAIITDYGAISTNSGKEERRDEVDMVIFALAELNVPILGSITDPAYLDGGDVVRVNDHYFLGETKRDGDIRTTWRGLNQLGKMLKKLDHTYSRIQVNEALHLSTGSSYIGNNTVLSIPEFAYSYAKSFFARHNGINVLTSQKGEEYAANMRLVNGHLIMPAGFPRTRELVEPSGHKIIEVELSEFRKQNGSATCLSLLIPREFKKLQ